MYCYVFYPTVFENCHKATGQPLIFTHNNKCLVNFRKRLVNLCILGYWLQRPHTGHVDSLAASFPIGEIFPCEKKWINCSILSELKKHFLLPLSIFHGVAKSLTRLSDWTTTMDRVAFQFFSSSTSVLSFVLGHWGCLIFSAEIFSVTSLHLCLIILIFVLPVCNFLILLCFCLQMDPTSWSRMQKRVGARCSEPLMLLPSSALAPSGLFDIQSR